MSTRCMIGIENDDKSIDMVYCHHDGYPKHVGYILYTCYNTVDRIMELINHGDLSSLCSSIKGTRFYHRDFNDDWEDVKPCKYPNLKDIPLPQQEYFYLFKDNNWYEMNKGKVLVSEIDTVKELLNK